jgi:hypothetical protein
MSAKSYELGGGERIAMRPDLAVFPLDNEVVVFSETSQRVINLNESAALVFGELQKSTPVTEIVRALVSRGAASSQVAETWVTTTLGALRLHGMLEGEDARLLVASSSDSDALAAKRSAGMPAYTSLNTRWERCYRLLNTRALIRCGHSTQVRLVDSVIGHLRTEICDPDIVIEAHYELLDNKQLRSQIYCDGMPVASAPRLSMLGPIVKSTLWYAATNNYDFLFYLHAGVVGLDGNSCLMLPAAAGSGKSSLTAALTRSGLSYFSDEVALLHRSTFCVPPVPLAICVKDTGWDLVAPHYPEFARYPVHNREDGKCVRYIPPPANQALRPAPVSHIVFPRYQKDSPNELVPIARPEALGRLMEECVALRRRLDQEDVEKLVAWIAGIHCFTLTFSSIDDAVRLIRGSIL